MGKMKRNRNDVVAEIKTARAEAQIRANAYKNLTAKWYDYWRAMSAVLAYDEALALFEQDSEHEIPVMAATAVADFERVHDSEDPEVVLAVMDGRRDALASVADWMSAEEINR